VCASVEDLGRMCAPKGLIVLARRLLGCMPMRGLTVEGCMPTRGLNAGGASLMRTFRCGRGQGYRWMITESGGDQASAAVHKHR
jgi:hypothetical protein